jgi:hypothetical protein
MYGIDNYFFFPILSIFSSLILLLGVDFVGQQIFKIKILNEVISNISLVSFQRIIFTLNILLFILYPLILYKFYSLFFLNLISYLFFFFGLINFGKIILSSKNIIKIIKSHLVTKRLLLFSIFIFFYFLFVLGPIGSADSLDYHAGVAQSIINLGTFPVNSYAFHEKLAGSGEILVAIGLLMGAEQFGTLIQFSGFIGIIGIFLKFLNIKKNTFNFYIFLAIICSPVFLFLSSTYKPQLFHIASNLLAFAMLFLNFRKKNFLFIFFLSLFILMISTQAKFSFNLTSFVIILFFLIFNYNFLKKYFLKINLIIIFLFLIIILPTLFWKKINYGGDLFSLFINPFPMNLAGFDAFKISLQNVGRQNSIVNLIYPTSITDFSNSLGVCSIVLLFMNIKNIKVFIMSIFFFIISINFGQLSARFFIEPILWISLILVKEYRPNKNIFEKLFKYLVLFQAFIIFIILIYGVIFISLSSLTLLSRSTTLSKIANGYSLYKWSNQIIPKESVLLSTLRSVSLSGVKTLSSDFLFYVSKRNDIKFSNLFNEIKEEKPNFLLTIGTDDDNLGAFKNCVSGLFAKKENIYMHAARNPFFDRVFRNGYVYYLNYKLLPDCLLD